MRYSRDEGVLALRLAGAWIESFDDLIADAVDAQLYAGLCSVTYGFTEAAYAAQLGFRQNWRQLATPTPAIIARNAHIAAHWWRITKGD